MGRRRPVPGPGNRRGLMTPATRMASRTTSRSTSTSRNPRTLPVVAEPESAPAGTRVYRRSGAGRAQYGTVTAAERCRRERRPCGREAQRAELFRQEIRVAVGCDRGPRPRPARLAPPGSWPTHPAGDPAEAVPGDPADASPAIQWTPRRRSSGWTGRGPAQPPPRSPPSRPPARRSSSRTRAGPAGPRGRSVFRRP